ncbi:hypothetical protein BRADI_3g50893v3 [Brachypodium distachyon]|uniref:Uncharacterized protein n=1 Tax=Brachypodium distachyon TaxID=15368 RepID=A0A2K2D4J5_BRADI|nr:hypothetical protein BRADI_3g50893v3 [Brachypodium distachyon]
MAVWAEYVSCVLRFTGTVRGATWLLFGFLFGLRFPSPRLLPSAGGFRVPIRCCSWLLLCRVVTPALLAVSWCSRCFSSSSSWFVSEVEVVGSGSPTTTDSFLCVCFGFPAASVSLAAVSSPPLCSICVALPIVLRIERGAGMANMAAARGGR